MTTLPSEQRVPTGLGLASIVLWSTTVAFGRSLSEQVGMLTTAFLIYLIGGLLGSVYLVMSGRYRSALHQGKRYLSVCGGLFAVYTVAFYVAIGLAVNRSQVLELGLINYLWPTLTVVFSAVLLKKRMTVFFIPGVIAATVGVVIATTQNAELSWQAFMANVLGNPVAYIMALTAAVSWGLYSALSRKWGEGGDSEAVPLFMLLTAAVLGAGLLIYPEDSQWSLRSVAELLFLATGSNLAYVFWEIATRRGDITLVASASYFTPLLSTLISVGYLGVPAGMRLWAGCILVILGAAVSKASMKER